MIHSIPEPGDIAVVRMDGRVGRLVRIGQWLNGDGFADYEHAFIYVGDGQIIEAEPGGARVASVSEYDGRPVVYGSPDGLTGEQRQAICDEARRMVGTPYSGLDYLALALHHFRVPAPGLRRYIADTGHLICSALCDEAYRRAGVHLFTDQRWSGFVTPADLYQLLGREEAQR